MFCCFEALAHCDGATKQQNTKQPNITLLLDCLHLRLGSGDGAIDRRRWSDATVATFHCLGTDGDVAVEDGDIGQTGSERDTGAIGAGGGRGNGEAVKIDSHLSGIDGDPIARSYIEALR